MSLPPAEHDPNTVSGATFRRWFQFIRSEEDGEARLEEILKNLSEESRSALGQGPEEARTYSNEVFNDF